MWWDAACVTGGESMTLTDAMDSSPVLVSAFVTVRDATSRRIEAEMKSRVSSGNAAR